VTHAFELVNQVLCQVAPEAEIASIDANALLQEQIDMDSLDFLHLVTGISDEAHIDIPERDYPYLATLNGAYAYVGARLTA
jgi:acyl carrier protein